MKTVSNKEFPKFLKVCSAKQAFRLWLDFRGNNCRVSRDLFDMFGGSNSKLYQEWVLKQEKINL